MNISRDSRRSFIKKSAMGIAGASLLPGYTFNILKGKKSGPETVGHGNFTYRVDKEWGLQDPGKIPVRDCHEMVQDRMGRILLLTNEEKNNLIVYDKSGQVIKTVGLDMPGAHGLTLAEEGDEEFLFITDHARHQIFKATLDGRIIMTLDFPEETGVYESPEKYNPTEIAVAPNGDIYVADGYGENYIIQYNARGEYIRHFGGKGEGDEQFDCCHGVTLDTREMNNPTLLITSRSKNEFKRFSLSGEYLETIPLPGCWICRPVIRGDYLYFAVIVTRTWDSYDGMLAILDKNNRVISFPGGSEPVYQDGKLTEPVYDGKTFLNPHDVCIDDEENLYIPQWNSEQTYPVKLIRV
ncbi:MAG: 6-bladed beta-propeller [Cyclobacteriaceae bacterium]|nr:6-bladed beta-propeller [Cyclobacteriaceae bacterium]